MLLFTGLVLFRGVLFTGFTVVTCIHTHKVCTSKDKLQKINCKNTCTKIFSNVVDLHTYSIHFSILKKKKKKRRKKNFTHVIETSLAFLRITNGEDPKFGY
jgi:hypothetical protein